MFEEESWETIGRRSKLDIACEILRVISDGTEKPTRIIQKANLSWKGFLLYLEALTRNQLVTRRMVGARAVYTLTEKGVSVLGLYTRLREEVAALRLGALSEGQLSEALKETPKAPPQASVAATLSAKLTAAGFALIENKVAGGSGTEHTFDVLARGANGDLHGYEILGRIGDREVIASFIKQLDTDVVVHVIATGEITPEARKLAKDYAMSLSPRPEP